MPLLTDSLRLADISFAEVDEASTTRDDAQRMLRHLTAIARPREGAAILLVALSHLASRAWLRGALRARLRAHEDGVELEIVEDLGGGQRVPFFRRTIDVPLEELASALPHLPLRPLRLVRKADDAIVLAVALRGKRGSIEPPPPSEPPPADEVPGAPRVPKDAAELDESW